MIHGIDVSTELFHYQIFKANFLGLKGKPETLEMGCYGIGVSRVMAAATEVCKSRYAVLSSTCIFISDRSDTALFLEKYVYSLSVLNKSF